MTSKLNIFVCVCVHPQVFSSALSTTHIILWEALYVGVTFESEEWQKKIKWINNDNNRSNGNKSYYLLKALHVSFNFILFNLCNSHRHAYHNVKQKGRKEGTVEVKLHFA